MASSGPPDDDLMDSRPRPDPRRRRQPHQEGLDHLGPQKSLFANSISNQPSWQARSKSARISGFPDPVDPGREKREKPDEKLDFSAFCK